MSVGRIAGKAAAEQLIGMEEMLRKQAEKHLEPPQDGTGQNMEQRSVLEAVRAANTGVMGGNFAGSRFDPESSRYVEASLKSMEVLKEQKRNMIAQVWANSDRLGGLQGKSRQYIEREELRKALNESNDEIREDIENKAQEAQLPRDAEGNIIPGAAIAQDALDLASAAAAEAPVTAPSAAPAPAPAPDAAPAGQQAALAPQIDIKV